MRRECSDCHYQQNAAIVCTASGTAQSKSGILMKMLDVEIVLDAKRGLLIDHSHSHCVCLCKNIVFSQRCHERAKALGELDEPAFIEHQRLRKPRQ